MREDWIGFAVNVEVGTFIIVGIKCNGFFVLGRVLISIAIATIVIKTKQPNTLPIVMY